jgi:hypothetical protein
LETQVPLEQTWVPEQARLQPPQWAALLRISTHAPPQSANPTWQENAQAPAWQSPRPLAGTSQALLHSPQWLASDSVSTQRPPQRVIPVWQAREQLPFVHRAVAPSVLGQAASQAPQ